MTQDFAGGFEKCLNLLRGNSDEQRLVGLLLATKYAQGDDLNSIKQIFDAVGIQFLNRLLKSGLYGTNLQDVAYVKLALSVLSAFCRIPDLAASDEIIEKIPTLLEILKKWPEDAICTDCLECLLGIALASDKGRLCLKESGTLLVLLKLLAKFKPGSDCVRSSLKLIQILISTDLLDQETDNSSGIIVSLIQVLAEVLLLEHGDLRLDVLHLLQGVCSPEILVQNHVPKEGRWADVMRSVLGQVLRSQCALEQKLLALEVTKSVIEYAGNMWLLGPMTLPGENKETPLDRFFLLLVETLRVETLVILNEVATSRFCIETSDSCKLSELMKGRQLLATCYFLLESVIDITIEEEDTERLSDVALERAVHLLNEIINTIVDFLQEAKRENISRGDDILASARLFGRYLADAPSFQKDLSKRFLSMLEYLFSITSDLEEGPVLVIQFLLPAISELIKETDGWRSFISWGGHKKVVAFMLKAIANEGVPSGALAKAGDVLLNILQKENVQRNCLGIMDFVLLLSALPSWADSTNDCMEISMAASICALTLSLANEDVVLRCISSKALSDVYSLLLRVLDYVQSFETSPEENEGEDMWEITLSACIGMADRYGSFKDCIKAYKITSSSNLLLNKLLQRCRETR